MFFAISILLSGLLSSSGFRAVDVLPDFRGEPGIGLRFVESSGLVNHAKILKVT